MLIHYWYNCLSGRPLLEGEGWDYFSWWRHFQGWGKICEVFRILSWVIFLTGMYWRRSKELPYPYIRVTETLASPSQKPCLRGPWGPLERLNSSAGPSMLRQQGCQTLHCFVPVETALGCLWGFPVYFQEYKANFLFITVLSHRLIIRIFPLLKNIFCVVLLWQRSTF